MFSITVPEPRQVNGVTLLGPDFFATDHAGMLLSPIATVFPRYRVCVAGREIHAVQIEVLLEALRSHQIEALQGEMSPDQEDGVYRDAVSLFTRGPVVLIRSAPDAMEQAFAADELLQQLLLKDRIQFTGIDLPEIRAKLRQRGESWRMSARPHSMGEICQGIEASRIHVATGATYYENAATGGRFLTYAEFRSIRPLLRQDRQEALARLREIVDLIRRTNNLGFHELTFFLAEGQSLTLDGLEDLIGSLDKAGPPEDLERVEQKFDKFAVLFAQAAGPELLVDAPSQLTWRTTMFCRLYNIDERMLEELALGLSREFHLNVQWLPGARLNGELYFESNVEPRVRHLITHYQKHREGLVSINVGRVESPLTERDRSGEEREVYLVVLGLADGSEDIRLARMMKWDVYHRLKQGIPLDQAIGETIQYRNYIFDRLRAAATLGLPILTYSEIQFSEEITGRGTTQVFFFDRCYVPGMVSDKIPPPRYAQPGFIQHLAELLAVAAGASLILGRACPRTGKLRFDDGDEVIQFDADGFPVHLVIAETTGSFTNYSAPVDALLPHCLDRLAWHLNQAREQGMRHLDLMAAIYGFAEALATEIERMQGLLQDPLYRLQSLFADRGSEPGGIRVRWESLLHRLETTDARGLFRLVVESDTLKSFMER
jgi:hypothetical protein